MEVNRPMSSFTILLHFSAKLKVFVLVKKVKDQRHIEVVSISYAYWRFVLMWKDLRLKDAEQVFGEGFNNVATYVMINVLC